MKQIALKNPSCLNFTIDGIENMIKLPLLFIGILMSLMSLGQDPNQLPSIKVRDGKIEKHIFFLVTKNGNVELDSTELGNISPEWIKAINIVKRSDDAIKDHINSSLSTASVFIELKKKYLKKYMNRREEE